MSRQIFRTPVTRVGLGLAGLFLALCAAGAAARSWPPRPAEAAPGGGARPAQQEPEDAPESEVITLMPEGFEPAEVTRREGQFLLVVDNRSGREEVTWRLESEAGRKLREVKLKEGQLRSSAYEDLPPGTYLLSADGHPGGACRLTITPN